MLGVMSMFEDINQHRYLNLLEIGETEEWELRLVVAEAMVVEEASLVSVDAEPNEAIRELITSSRPIKVTDASAVYEIVFSDYILYSVINESYVSGCEGEEYEGRLARVYTKSAFLEYVQKSTFATEEYPGPFKHYGLCCSDHIVDIAAVEPPRVVRENDA